MTSFWNDKLHYIVCKYNYFNLSYLSLYMHNDNNYYCCYTIIIKTSYILSYCSHIGFLTILSHYCCKLVKQFTWIIEFENNINANAVFFQLPHNPYENHSKGLYISQNRWFHSSGNFDMMHMKKRIYMHGMTAFQIKKKQTQIMYASMVIHCASSWNTYLVCSRRC